MSFAVADEDAAVFVHENAAGACESAVERFVATGAVALVVVFDEDFEGCLFDTKTADRMRLGIGELEVAFGIEILSLSTRKISFQ
jgi:hypothetical protein